MWTKVPSAWFCVPEKCHGFYNHRGEMNPDVGKRELTFYMSASKGENGLKMGMNMYILTSWPCRQQWEEAIDSSSSSAG